MIPMSWLRSALGILVIIGAASGARGQSEPPPTPTPLDAETAVEARLADIQRAAEALDPDKVFSYVLKNDKGALIQNGKLFPTRQAALRSTRQGFQGLDEVAYRFEQQHVTLLSPTIALATGEGVSTATTNDGRTIRSRFAQSVVLVLTDGQWKVFHAHRSFPPSK